MSEDKKRYVRLTIPNTSRHTRDKFIEQQVNALYAKGYEVRVKKYIVEGFLQEPQQQSPLFGFLQSVVPRREDPTERQASPRLAAIFTRTLEATNGSPEKAAVAKYINSIAAPIVHLQELEKEASELHEYHQQRCTDAACDYGKLLASVVDALKERVKTAVC